MNVRRQKLSPETALPGTHGLTLVDYWAWAYSDVLSNANRAVFAEFLVASSLGIAEIPRIEWDAVDLRYRSKTIEVKASAYVQSWAAPKTSPAIRFDISRKLGWDAETNTYLSLPMRSADCYTFCLFPEEDRSRAVTEVLNAGAWLFCVLPTSTIESALGNQKSISLTRIKAICGNRMVRYDELKREVDAIFDQLP